MKRMNSLYLEDRGTIFISNTNEELKRTKRYLSFKKIVVVINKNTGEIKEYAKSIELAKVLNISKPAVSNKINRKDSRKKGYEHLTYRFMFKPIIFEKVENRIVKTHKNTYTRIYRLWDNMRNRCNYPDTFPTYKDVSYDSSWDNYYTFLQDVMEIDGFAEWRDSKTVKEYHLDKDIKIPGNKHYCKDSCSFVLGSENAREALTRYHRENNVDHSSKMKGVMQYNMDGEFIAEYKNAKDAGDAVGRTDGAIRSCISGRTKKSAGFKWKYKNK